ncbi:MAG: transglycosylase SLT domain-containing protein [Acidiferrobacterales bacterium]
MITRFSFGFILVLGILTPPPVIAATDASAKLESQRRAYQDALAALRSNQIWRYKMLLNDLDGYVLRGHLEFQYLKEKIASTPTETLRAYLASNQNSVTSDFLRKRWLTYLARQGDWDLFLGEYKDTRNDKNLYCHRLDRLIRRADQDQAELMTQVEKLWMTGKRLPKSCNPVFLQWRAAGHMSRDIVFARIKLAMESRRLTLAKELSYYLSATDRKWVTRWIQMHRRPARELAAINFRINTPVARMIVKHGVVRLAYRDPEAAMEVWSRLTQQHRFFGEDNNYVNRNVGILGAKRHLPQAVAWLSAVSADDKDKTLRYWRIRAAIRASDWETAQEFIGALKEEESKKDEWRYWQARIVEENEDEDVALDMFSVLAKERSYYGFLAADRLDAPYSMKHRTVNVSEGEVRAMLERPDIRIAYELFNVGQIVSARRQWYWLIRHMNNRELQVAAVVAKKWGWHDRAIFTVVKSGHLDDLDLRFPVLFRDKVEFNAQRSGVDPGWIYGIMRQESAFVSDARSGAGALGLMQLMPRTGRATARRLHLNIRSRSAILNIDNNLRLGTHYLKTVLRRHKGNQIIATAAYNAGSHRVNRWLPKKESMPADIWVDTIPFNETRNYVKNVMGFTTIYEHRLNLAPTPLRSRMGEVRPHRNNSS